MATLTRLCVLFVVCFSLVCAVQHSDRTFESFSPDVPLAHIHGIEGAKVNYLNYFPTIETEDSHLIAINLAEQVLGYPVTYNVKNSYVTEHNKVRHLYLKQTASDGREIFNADLNINVQNKRALNVGHSFYNGSTAPVQGSLSSVDAVKMLVAGTDQTDSVLTVVEPASGIDFAHKIDGVKGSVSPANVRAGYVQVENGKRLVPVWDIQLDMDIHWWNAHVSMHDGQVLSLFDWVNDAQYNAYPIGTNDPSDGSRAVVVNPANPLASRLGWHSINATVNFTTTIGNNAYAQSNPTGGSSWLNNPRPSGGSTLVFNFPINFTAQPVTYINASTTNLFAWNNYIHDIFYQYGFNEPAANFQENNFGLGGLGNDAVQANSQDGAGMNNANFATPVDGQRPRMRMYNWNASIPHRDGDLDQGIIIHEYLHGISNRLTGGGANVNCLGSGEAGGMGEGWGDFFANVIRQRSTYNRNTVFPMGAYSANVPGGIRKFPYTTDMKIDPETYAYINNLTYAGVHPKGEVWCGILWETYWNMVDKYGFNPNLYTGTGGNNKIIQNVIDGMKIQPCNPNFVKARDAILLADQANYGGVNLCSLWAGFAKRGLGVNAVGTSTGVTLVKEDYSVPAGC